MVEGEDSMVEDSIVEIRCSTAFLLSNISMVEYFASLTAVPTLLAILNASSHFEFFTPIL